MPRNTLFPLSSTVSYVWRKDNVSFGHSDSNQLQSSNFALPGVVYKAAPRPFFFPKPFHLKKKKEREQRALPKAALQVSASVRGPQVPTCKSPFKATSTFPFFFGKLGEGAWCPKGSNTMGILAISTPVHI